MMTAMPHLIRMVGKMIMVLVVMIKRMMMIIFMVRVFMLMALGTLARRRRRRRTRIFLITGRNQTLSPPSSTAQGASENSDKGMVTTMVTPYSQEDVPSSICT